MINENDIVIVGGQGDLAFRKLYPALYHLDEANCFGDDVRVFGLGRHDMSQEDFVAKVKERFEFYVGPVSPELWKRFSKRLNFYKADVKSEADMKGLCDFKLGCDGRPLTVYLATPPSIFSAICETMKAVGLVTENTRIVVEKPLGHDEASFQEINRDLMSIFVEEQVYRIDHYLGKETVQNLLALRFANSLFEPLWNNHHIDHVQITVAESVGAEGRWSFYDEAGAMRDMVQNHLLQLLCLVAMEPPSKLEADCVRDEKLKVLRSLKPLTPQEVKKDTVRGQYTSGAIDGEIVPGYLEEEDAGSKKSNTETFVALKTGIDNWRWSGVPFYLRTGKRLAHRFSDIVIQFKQAPHMLFDQQGLSNTHDRLIIRLQPNEGIRMQLMNKVPGFTEQIQLQQVMLDLTYDEAFAGRRSPSAYERLILDVMRGNPTLFMRSDELEAAWKWVDVIINQWNKTNQPAVPYMAGSWGPSESVGLMARDELAWQNFEY